MLQDEGDAGGDLSGDWQHGLGFLDANVPKVKPHLPAIAQ
jgi:hypothetical protein